MNQKELEKIGCEGLAYVLRLIVDRRIKDDEIAGKLMDVNGKAYDILGYEGFERDLKFCMDSAKYVRGEYSPSFLLFQAKGLDELINDERCNKEFEVVDRIFDEVEAEIGDLVLGEVDYFTGEEMIPHLKITAAGRLDEIRMRERCGIRAGQQRYVGTRKDLRRILKYICKDFERRSERDPNPKTKYELKEAKRQYEILLEKL